MKVRPMNLTWGLGPLLRAPEPYLGPRTLIQGAKLSLRAQDSDSGPMTLIWLPSP